MNALDVPLVFVPGNHDPDLSGYRTSRAGLTLRPGLPARPPWPDRCRQRRRQGGRRGRPADRRARRLPQVQRRPQPVQRPAAGPAGAGLARRGVAAAAAGRPRRRRAAHPRPAARHRRRRRSGAPRVQRLSPSSPRAARGAAARPRAPGRAGAFPRPQPGRPHRLATAPAPEATSVQGAASQATLLAHRGAQRGWPDLLESGRPAPATRRAPRCPLTPGFPARTSRTTSCAPGAARCWPGWPSGCAASRTTSTSSCRFDEVVAALGQARRAERWACRRSSWTRWSARSTRSRDFDRRFRPTSGRVRARWERLALAQRRGESIPPIDVYRVGDLHFVVRTATTGCRSRWPPAQRRSTPM